MFVYSVDRSDPQKAEVASRLIRGALEEGSGRISYQVVQEFLNVALKKFQYVMSTELASVYVIDELGPMFAVEPSLRLFDKALDVHDRYQLSWYDSLIVAAALEAKCDVLYTEDLQHGQRFGNLLVTNPFL